MDRNGSRRSGRAAPLSAALDNLVSRMEGRVRVKERLAALVWRDCVGDFYAERTRVTRVHRGIMYVWCGSPALAHQVSLDAEEIARRINRELSGAVIKEIRPSTTGARRETEEPKAGAPRIAGPRRAELEGIALTPEEVAEVDREAATVPNEELRARFREAAISERRADRWKEGHGYRRCPACAWWIPPGLLACSWCGRSIRA